MGNPNSFEWPIVSSIKGGAEAGRLAFDDGLVGELVVELEDWARQVCE